MSRNVRELMGELQEEMLQVGGRLPILDATQNPKQKRNNNIEGKEYHQPNPEGETTHMSTTKEETKEVTKKKEETITPAGGVSDAETAQAVSTVFKKFAEMAGNAAPKTLGRKFLDEAIPAGVTAAAVVLVYTGITLVNRKWGKGAIDRERMLLVADGRLPAEMQ